MPDGGFRSAFFRSGKFEVSTVGFLKRPARGATTVGPAFGSFFGTLTKEDGEFGIQRDPLSLAAGAFGSFLGMAAAVCWRDLGFALRAWLSSSVSSSCS
jgi:hypothetical protein